MFPQVDAPNSLHSQQAPSPPLSLSFSRCCHLDHSANGIKVPHHEAPLASVSHLKISLKLHPQPPPFNIFHLCPVALSGHSSVYCPLSSAFSVSLPPGIAWTWPKTESLPLPDLPAPPNLGYTLTSRTHVLLSYPWVLVCALPMARRRPLPSGLPISTCSFPHTLDTGEVEDTEVLHPLQSLNPNSHSWSDHSHLSPTHIQSSVVHVVISAHAPNLTP